MSGIKNRYYIDLTKPSSGGGGGGASSYIDLSDKPKMNGTTIVGNKTSSDYGLQDELVSGTNIKTINNTSILGSGNIEISVGANYDDVTINLNSSYEIQTVGQIELNDNTATFDWVGTLAEYEAGRLDESIPDTYICYITDDYSTANSVVTDVQFNGNSVVTDFVANITDSNIRSVAPACTVITASDTTATLVANTTYAHAVSSSGCTYTLTTPSSASVYSGFILMLDTTNSASIAFQTDAQPAVSILINGNPTLETGKKYTVTAQFNVLDSAWNIWIIEYGV